MNWRPRTCFSCTCKKKSWMGVPPPCSVFIDARESIKNISSCYASACFLLSLSVSFCCCLHRKWHPYYIIRYISQRNRHEMIWNDLCPLSDSKIAQVIGFVFKRHSLRFIYLHPCSWWPMLPATPLYSRVTEWVTILVNMSHLHPDMESGGVGMMANKGD